MGAFWAFVIAHGVVLYRGAALVRHEGFSGLRPCFLSGCFGAMLSATASLHGLVARWACSSIKRVGQAGVQGFLCTIVGWLEGECYGFVFFRVRVFGSASLLLSLLLETMLTSWESYERSWTMQYSAGRCVLSPFAEEWVRESPLTRTWENKSFEAISRPILAHESSKHVLSQIGLQSLQYLMLFYVTITDTAIYLRHHMQSFQVTKEMMY